MHYLIDARLENGIPHVTIRDADTGRVKLQWTRAGDVETATDGAAGQALHGLFKDLVLLSCADQLNSAEQAQATRFCDERARGCMHVSRAADGAAQTAPPDNVVSLTKWRRASKPGAK